MGLTAVDFPQFVTAEESTDRTERYRISACIVISTVHSPPNVVSGTIHSLVGTNKVTDTVI